MLLQIYVAILTEMSLLSYKLLKSEMCLKEHMALGSVLCGRTSDNVQAFCTPKQSANTLLLSQKWDYLSSVQHANIHTEQRYCLFCISVYMSAR